MDINTLSKAVCYVFEECPDCGTPMRTRKVREIPPVYSYQDYDMDGLPTYCIGTANRSCCNYE